MSLQGNKGLGDGSAYIISAVVALIVIAAIVGGVGYLVVHFLF